MLDRERKTGGERGRPSARRGAADVTGLASLVLRAQRTAGNAAATRVAGALVQRQHVDLAGHRSVGAVSGPGANVREDVLVVMDRLHMLWSLDNDGYREHAAVAALPAGQAVPEATIPNTIAAIARNERPSIAPAVAREFLNLRLAEAIGPGEPNTAADVTALQQVLHAHRALGDADLAAERVTTGPVDLSRLPRTCAALVLAKQAIASGHLGWAPIHLAEHRLGDDRFGGQTFAYQRPGRSANPLEAVYGRYSIFVPRGAGPANNVRVHFSAGGVVGGQGTNAVLQHGLRSASDDSSWITVAVPGIDNRTPNPTTAAEVAECLLRVGRPGRIDALMLTAHSRGASSLATTLNRGGLPGALVQRVVIYDANWKSVASAIRHAGIPPSRVTAYAVNEGILPLPGSRTADLRAIAGPLRAIGFLRIIESARVLRPDVAIPPDIQAQLIPLPPLGAFTTTTPPPPGKTGIVRFCHDHRAALATILDRAQGPHGLQYFIELHDLGRFGRRSGPPGQQIAPGTYSHHLFVTELAHEATE